MLLFREWNFGLLFLELVAPITGVTIPLCDIHNTSDAHYVNKMLKLCSVHCCLSFCLKVVKKKTKKNLTLEQRPSVTVVERTESV